MPPQRTCTYVKANGAFCQMVATNDSDLCRFHLEDAEKVKNHRLAVLQRRTEMSRHGIGRTSFGKVPGVDGTYDDLSVGLFSSLQLPPLEDANAIQVTLTTMVRALATQQIPPRNASLILYALQLACANRAHMQKPCLPYDKVAMEKPPALPGPNDV